MNFLSLEGERSFSFTLKGNNKLRALEEELRGSELFSPLIYDEMRTEIRAIPFGDYLKRYIYVNSTLVGNTTSPSYTVTGLDANSPYTIGVSAACGNDEGR